MTAKELAEKILTIVREPISGTPNEMAHNERSEIESLLSAALEDAKDEAYDHANKDFDWLQSAVGKVYYSLTNGKLSKWNTDPDLLIAEVEDIQNEFWEREIAEAKAAAYEECAKIAHDYSCHSLGGTEAQRSWAREIEERIRQLK